MSNVTLSLDDLPNSLRLPPHLSAHKYFFVCTLTVAAWDTLVLSPRSWKLLKSEGWPVLKAIFFFLRIFMPVEFVIVGVAFFDSAWSRSVSLPCRNNYVSHAHYLSLQACQGFFLFEPICTAVLLAACSAVHTIRIHGIYDKNRSVLYGISAFLVLQVVVTAICCAFYRSVPLLEGQGCVAGPKHNWVGVYWLSITLFYTASLALAVNRSIQSLSTKTLSPWKLMLRDGLNLYGAIWFVNMVNMLFWFIIKPDSDGDSIKTIVTSMAAVLTTTMTLRIILSVRGTLYYGGSFAGVWSTSTGTHSATRGIGSARGPANAPSVLQINSHTHSAHTYTLDGIGQKVEHGWDGAEGKPDILPIPEHDHKGSTMSEPDYDTGYTKAPGLQGVKITVDREIVDFDPSRTK
ncbi:hypothetical protein B0F90DRAFT_1243530 [Multifurca ochricompacta]|uniref:Uncharacterized protein n=1 Tax=Multifurca ochricompacta TaxID=376703 RepID=A0AAD4M7K6_9AGAM|nr:hypothetical protein B0F90DRAFT_1243530 [Multifurca ochricompacta]